MPLPETSTAGSDALTSRLLGMIQELPGLFTDRVELFSLEVQRAAAVLTKVAVLVVAVGILGVTAWLALWVCIVAGLMALGMTSVWALATVLLINLAAACWVIVRIRSLLPLIGLPATRRHLTRTSTARPS